MKTISIDIESFSDIDLYSCGVYKYAQSTNFYIMLFGYSVDGGEVQVVDLMAGQEIPDDILKALTDPNVTKWAYNAIFERVCLSEYLRRFKPKYFKGYGDPDDSTRKYISPKGWKCTMTWAAYMGLPLSLKNVGFALNLDDKKMEEGKDTLWVQLSRFKKWTIPKHRLSELSAKSSVLTIWVISKCSGQRAAT